MNRNTSSSSLNPRGGFASSSSSGSPIRAPTPIVPLREAPESKGSPISEISSNLSKQDIDRLYDIYHIPQKTFRVFSPSPLHEQCDPCERHYYSLRRATQVGSPVPSRPIFC